MSENINSEILSENISSHIVVSVNHYLKLCGAELLPVSFYVQTEHSTSGGSRIFKQGVADLTEQYRNNRRQSGLRDSFVNFLNLNLE